MKISGEYFISRLIGKIKNKKMKESKKKGINKGKKRKNYR